MSRVEATRPLRLALAQARRTLALQRFGHAFCTRYGAAKLAGGWLDFDDLITRTARLLDCSTMAQWVLFRLVGGNIHIMYDDATLRTCVLSPLRGGETGRGLAGFRRPDHADSAAAGQLLHGAMGAVPAGRGHRPYSGGRGAGHLAPAMAGDPAGDGRIHRRRR